MQYGAGNAVTQAKRYGRHVISPHHQKMAFAGTKWTKSQHKLNTCSFGKRENDRDGGADISSAFLLLHVWLCEGLSVALLAGLVSFSSTRPP